MSTRIIGLGQRFGGDDAAGLAVLDRLKRMPLPEGVTLAEAKDGTALVELLAGVDRALIVDALLGPGAPGRIHHLTPAQLGKGQIAAFSTHGLDVGASIALAGMLYPETVAGEIHIVGIEIARAERYRQGLSPAVEAAVDEAADMALRFVCDGADR